MAIIATAAEQLKKITDSMALDGGGDTSAPVRFITAEQQFQSKYMQQDETPVNILEFIQASWGPGMTPYPMQRLMLKCLYKLPLDNTVRDIKLWDKTKKRILHEFTEIECLKFLKEERRTNVTAEEVADPKKPFTTVVMIIGRRAGKTTWAGWISAYEAYCLLRKKNPQKYYNIAQHQDIGIIAISTGKDHATELFQGMAGMVENSTFFQPYLMTGLKRSIQLTTRYNREMGQTNRVGISLRSASCSARGLRGPQRIVVVLDEYGHFSVSMTGQNRSDKSVWNAVKPSLVNMSHPDGLPAGKIIAITTPLNRDSHAYELSQQALDGSPGFLYFNMPSVWINDRLNTYELEQEYASDEDKANQEYGAEFTDRVSGALKAVDLMATARTGPTILTKRNWLTFLGMDVGGMGSGKTDGCAWHVLHYEGERKVSTYHEYIDPNKEPDRFPLSIKEVAEHTVQIFREFKCVFGIYDQWNGYGMQALMRDFGVREWTGKLSDPLLGMYMISFTESLNSKMWKYVLDVAEAGQVSVYDDELIKELYQLQKVQVSADRIRVKAPQLRYYHDDRADAWARALWAAKMYYDQNPGKLKTLHSGYRPERVSVRQRMASIIAKASNPRTGDPEFMRKLAERQGSRPIKPRRNS